MKKDLLLLLLMFVVTMSLGAENFEVDGIAYNPLGGDSAEVTSKATYYSGDITIPATVNYESTTYRVTSIGDDAFYGCDFLSSITIPNSVTSIGDRAFAFCYSLISIKIPHSVSRIGKVAFSECYSLSSINVDAANTCYASIDGVLFDYAKDTLIQYPIGNTRTSYTIPDGVIRIKERAFYYCSSLSSITIPNSVTYIEWWTFSNCSSLTSITLPDNVTSIAASTFSDCSSLRSITFGNNLSSIGFLAFSGCNSLTSIILPNSVDSIADRAFSYCPSLRSVTLPISLTTLGWGAFYECDSLRSITCYATTPPTCGANCFYKVTKSIPLYVPAGSTSAYQSAYGWQDFTNIQVIPDTPTAINELQDSPKLKVVSQKIMMDGRLLIQRANRTYTATGQEW